jgi:hypothetical protein
MVKIKVPQVVGISTHKYRVGYKRHLSEDEGYRGVCNHRTQTIEIEPTLPPSRKDQTFLHEVGHLIRKVYVMNEDEDNIDRAAQGYAELLFNNLGIQFDWSNIKEL